MAFNRDNRDRGGFRSRPSFGNRPRFSDSPRFAGGAGRGPAEMHSAVCDNCGKNCEVPFRPTSGKPVYCSNCFERKNTGGRSDNRNGFEEINAKLDTILQLLENQKPVVKEKKPAKIKEVAAEELPQ